jgi:hypothetical protein
MPKIGSQLILNKLIKRIGTKFGYSIISNDSLKSINQRLSEAEESKLASQILSLLEIMEVSDTQRFLEYGKLSNAQLLQDLFVLESCDFKRNGYFVEFGATDGIRHSNTYLLEKVFGWDGILAEPATTWHTQLLLNRSAKIDTRCVWRESDLTLEFSEDSSAELSSLTEYKNQEDYLVLKPDYNSPVSKILSRFGCNSQNYKLLYDKKLNSFI